MPVTQAASPAPPAPTPLDPVQAAELMARYGRQIDAAVSILPLLEVTCGAVAALLRRGSDATHRDKTLAVVARYFEAVVKPPQPASPDKLDKLKTFSREIIAVVIAERPLIAARARAAQAEEAAVPGRRLVDTSPHILAGCEPERMAELGRLAEADCELADEVVAARAEQIVVAADDRFSGADSQTAVTSVKPPPPYVCTAFDDLFPAAMCYRVSRITRFFQRYNPLVTRGMTRPFLLAPAFSDRFEGVVRDIIVPRMRSATRNIAVIENSRKWEGANVQDFWEMVETNERFLIPVRTAWQAAWDQCRQRRVDKPGAKSKSVLVAAPVLQDVRRRLAPVEGEYTLPTIRNSEIDLLSALAFVFDPVEMERHWARLRQLYEQELDTRVYQDKAREGALRDSILQAFEKLPDMIGEFMTMLCYFCFPNLDLLFLERFTHNKGQTVAARREKIPFLMQFLENPCLAAVMQDEARARAIRQEAAREAKARRREAEQ